MEMLGFPALQDMCQSEKKLEEPEIRVWCHPHSVGKDGDDYYRKFTEFEDAFDFIANHKEAEIMPLVAWEGYELNIFRIGS